MKYRFTHTQEKIQEATGLSLADYNEQLNKLGDYVAKKIDYKLGFTRNRTTFHCVLNITRQKNVKSMLCYVKPDQVRIDAVNISLEMLKSAGFTDVQVAYDGYRYDEDIVLNIDVNIPLK